MKEFCVIHTIITNEKTTLRIIADHLEAVEDALEPIRDHFADNYEFRASEGEWQRAGDALELVYERPTFTAIYGILPTA